MINKLSMKSKDIISDNIDKISELFPNCISEGKINFEMLKQELSKDIIEDGKERYQLTWAGKQQAILNANIPTRKTLRPMKSKSIDFDNTKNIYIEGDNLEALKILQNSYLNKIKCIYIDPPYNTGNDFVYNDNFYKTEKEELIEEGRMDEKGNILTSRDINNNAKGKFHSSWISMIYSRIKLARNLLKMDGAIYISIDENEIINLRKIRDEIFGERNFVARQGEIDIIAKDKNEIVFIEVKSRTNFLYGKPVEAVNRLKQKHLKSVINYYLYRNKLENNFVRIDIIEVYIKNGYFKINHIKKVIL